MTLNEAQRAAVADVVVGDDPYLWLEAVDGEEALDWVERHNGPTLARSRVNGSSRCAPRRSTCSTPTPGSPG
jgi:hypothetical protein